MLRIAEELLLLLIDKDTGDLAFVPGSTVGFALAGSVLMDLALEERIDTDLERLFLIDPTPLGDELLDPWLASIANDSGSHDASYWVGQFASPAEAARIRESATKRLIDRGILERDSGRLLSLARRVLRTRRYPMVDGKAEREVELRIMGLLFHDDVPTPRDTMLISVAHACGLIERLLTRSERAEVAEKLDWICGLELIGRAIFHAIRKADRVRAEARPKWVRGAATSAMRAQALASQPRADGGGIPVAGNAFDMRGDIVKFLVKHYRKLGPVYRVRAFHLAFTVLAGPEANMLLQRNGRMYFRNLEAYRGLADGLGAHRFILSMDGGDHFRLRRG